MEELRTWLRRNARYGAMVLLLLLSVAFGFSIDRYPGFYVDDAFFAYPAVLASSGGSLTYAVSVKAPFANQLWAYHGPLLPNLDVALFRLFGFSTVISKIPDFVGAWAAAFLVVWFLAKRRYRYAGLMFACLWAGDRVVQEVMYARMEGLALLLLVLAFLSLEKAWRSSSIPLAAVSGFACGLAVLAHPLCLTYFPIALVLVYTRLGWRGGCAFLLGGIADIPILLAFWRFHPHEAITQFLWHAHVQEAHMGLRGLRPLLHMLHWGAFWFVGLLAFSVFAGIVGLKFVRRRTTPLEEWQAHIVLAGSFAVAGMLLLWRSTLLPYYVVYFSTWPMLCLAIMAEKYKHARVVVAVMLLLWVPAAAWNALRVRESIVEYHQLRKSFLFAELNKDVPHNSTVVAAPELYSVPIEAHYPHYAVLGTFAEQLNACPSCYLLLTKPEFDKADYVNRCNLAQRNVLYSGPAFPAERYRQYPIVILSPIRPTADPIACGDSPKVIRAQN